ncbi:helix-turn-helix domain-containing protein [Microseira sp. BLCC-F43]|uniref:helix-turn-helix domain-containing protein n=1 Tax=Microseira sp. BLCC-F43 TaxID=3153602 RepID=UPI0035BAE7B6
MARAGKALRQVLETYGISQNQLAVAMGIGRSSINRWVNESRDPAAEAVLEIIEGLEKINQAAAGDFLALYLGRSIEHLEEQNQSE